MIDESSLPQPTVTSNSQAARLACHHERERVLRILATADGAVPDAIVEAITKGTPAAIFETNQRTAASKTAEARSGRARGHWGAITARINAQQKSKAERLATGDEPS